MRVIHTSMLVGQAAFGVGAAIFGLVRGQQKLGVDAQVWSCDPAPQRSSLELAGSLAGDSLHVFSTVGPSWLGFSPDMETKVRQAAISADVLHQHWIWTGVSRVSNTWRSACRKPTVINAHGALDMWAVRQSRWKKQLARLAYENSNLLHTTCFHALSMSELRALREFGISCPVAVIPNGVDSTWLSCAGDPDHFRNTFRLPEDKRVMLFLGRIAPKKGLLMLIHAMASSRECLAGWLLLIAGVDEAGHLAQVCRLVDDVGLQDHVRFVGPLYGQDKQDALAAAELFVLPSYSEGSPISLLEAMACGVPVITTNASPWERLNTLNCGWCTDISEEKLTYALCEALGQSSSALKAKGTMCRELIGAEYRWEHIAEMSIRMYQWLLRGGAPPTFVYQE